MKAKKQGRVVVAMSGGVDSSVAAALLQMQGYDIVGMSVQTFDANKKGEERFDSCCSLSDMDDARRVCESLGVPHFVVNAVDVFEAFVIDNFVGEYLSGRTPNPCVLCNNHIKFDFLLEKAKDIGADFVATGHYAKVYYDESIKRYGILRAEDEYKDQSYYLFGLTQEQLAHTLMPLGGLKKIQVRKMAKEFGLLRVSKKPDSHEICFVGKEGYAKFIEGRVAQDLLRKEAVFILPNGSRVGTDVGIHNFTVGQRKGIPSKVQRAISRAGFVSGDLYVSEIDSEKNRIVMSRDEALMHSKFVAERFNWLVGENLFLDKEVQVRVRSQQKPAKAKVRLHTGAQVYIEFEQPQRAITPGQAAVLYDGGSVIGGGWIRSVLHEDS